jgi:hypothetical protein
METLGRRHSIPSQQIPLLSNPWPAWSEWKTLTHLHSDTRELTQNDVEMFVGPHSLFKQHVLPTNSNITLLQSFKVVVLLRSSSDVVLSYRREALITKQVPMVWRGLESEAEWLARAEDAGLLSDLQAFRDGWSGRENALTIEFDHLLNEPEFYVASIERHLGLPTLNEDVSLEKYRWGRGKASEYRIPQTRVQRVGTCVSRLTNRLLTGLNLEIRRTSSQASRHRPEY